MVPNQEKGFSMMALNESLVYTWAIDNAMPPKAACLSEPLLEHAQHTLQSRPKETTLKQTTFDSRWVVVVDATFVLDQGSQSTDEICSASLTGLLGYSRS